MPPPLNGGGEAAGPSEPQTELLIKVAPDLARRACAAARERRISLRQLVAEALAAYLDASAAEAT